MGYVGLRVDENCVVNIVINILVRITRIIPWLTEQVVCISIKSLLHGICYIIRKLRKCAS